MAKIIVTFFIVILHVVGLYTSKQDRICTFQFSPNSVLLRNIRVIEFFTSLCHLASSSSILSLWLIYSPPQNSRGSTRSGVHVRTLVSLYGIDFLLQSAPPSFLLVFLHLSLTSNPVLLLWVNCRLLGALLKGSCWEKCFTKWSLYNTLIIQYWWYVSLYLVTRLSYFFLRNYTIDPSPRLQ